MLHKAFTAGSIIGLSCMIYASCSNTIIGALLFSIGLLTILYCKLPLYTGMVGCTKLKDTANLLPVIIFNQLGVMVIAFMCLFTFPESMIATITHIASSKISESMLNAISQAILCGVLMQMAVTAFRKDAPYLTVLCVASFIIAGFEHSIANFFWLFFCGKNLMVNVILYSILYLIGNGIGAKLINSGGVNYNTEKN